MNIMTTLQQQQEETEKKIRAMAANLMKMMGYSQTKAINKITKDLEGTGISKALVYYSITGRYLD